MKSLSLSFSLSLWGVLLVLVLWVPQGALAYIPRTKTIIKKMSRNNGRGEYKLVREVTLESKDQRVKAREIWTVATGNQMKVEVSSMDPKNSWKFAIVYSEKGRQTLSQKQVLRSFEKSPDFFEPLFHERSEVRLLKRFIQQGFIPQWLERATPASYGKGSEAMKPEPFVSLMPMEGTVSYAIGTLNNKLGGENETRIWVEQDSFLIKKARLRSKAEFVNSNYQTFPGGLKLPGEQRISWMDRLAKIELRAVERTKTKEQDWKLSRKKAGPIPSDSLIKEFYSRFR